MLTRHRTGRILAALALALAAGGAWAFPAVPKESGRALGATRGGKFSQGLVFINGKFIPPPYVVERWGTGLRVNGQWVSGQVIDWSEFLKTQSGVKVTKSETAASEPAPAAAAELPTEAGTDELSSSLDDLFDDNPKPRKASRPSASTAASRAPAKPRVSVSYSLDGDFVPNEASKALVARINAARVDVDRILRLGGFIFFGDNYDRVTGDARTADRFMRLVPELMQRSENVRSFVASLRSAGLVYISDQLGEDLFRNRIDYRALQEHRAVLGKDRELRSLLK